MLARNLHPWDVSPTEAVAIQKKFRNEITTENRVGPVNMVAGVDISIKKNIARAAVVVLSYPELEPLEESIIEEPVRFPYVPGLLSFREIPALIDAFEKLRLVPDLIIADGQGTAHPRRFGLACHLGLVLDIPTIGCAKSRLCGTHDDPDETAGSMAYLHHKEDIIGAAVRSKNRTRVLFVSPGHKIDLTNSIAFVLNCCRGYRLPETTRWAHRVAGGSVSLKDNHA